MKDACPRHVETDAKNSRMFIQEGGDSFKFEILILLKTNYIEEQIIKA